MKTIILPGFSPKNKEWAYATAQELSEAVVIEWAHWASATEVLDWDKWISDEVQKVIDIIGESKVNILAKSIGTLICMILCTKNPDPINKIILCGIPLTDISEEEKRQYEALQKIPLENILCIQNSQDNHGRFEEVETFLKSIASGIKIIPMEADNHEYPYFNLFKRFL